MMAYEAKRRAAVGLELKEAQDARLAALSTPTPPTKATPDPLSGLRVPDLETQIRDPQLLETISNQYTDFNNSSKWVLVQTEAYGLKPQLKNVLLVRRAASFWKQYFRAIQVFPVRPIINQAQIQTFYDKLSQIDAQTSGTIKSLNTIIDRERTRPWTRKVDEDD
jgi:hypothetical protein